MPSVFVIGPHDQSRFVSDAAKVVRDYGVEATPILAPPASVRTPPHEWVLHAFQHVADAIEQAAQRGGGLSGLRSAVAVVEMTDDLQRSLDELNPIAAKKWSAVVAMLVLSFPELHWCFNTSLESPASLLYKDAHMLAPGDMEEAVARLLDFREQNFTPLFDPTGMRNAIRARIRSQRERVNNNGVEGVRYVASYVPVRPRLAAVLDEEEDYAFLNAYIAYRFGFRVHMLTTFKMSEMVLRDETAGGGAARPARAPAPNSGVVHDDDISLTIEDLYLNYPDKDPESRLSLSNLTQRDDKFNKLPRAKYRIFHTVGHQYREEDRTNWDDNREYLTRLRDDDGVHCKMVYKPGSGIFDLWERSKLQWRLSEHGGRAPGYDWPPKKSDSGEAPGGHSAPGRLLVISKRLARRAERLLNDAATVPDSIHGSLLALEAQEYLGHRTPTGSLEALALKHKFEALAECMFYGVEYNMNVKDRLKEIEHEVAVIGDWFQPRSRARSKLNAELRIVSEIMGTFHAHSQFDEEQEMLARIRTLHRRLWFMRHRRWAWALYPVRSYVEFLLNSVPRFVVALGAWVGILTVTYGLIRDTPPDPPELTWSSLAHGFSDAITTFLGMQPPHDFDSLARLHNKVAVFGYSVPWQVIVVITAFAIIASFVHLGIFIAHLYSTIARK